jgi:hypothetical protein
LRLTFIVFKPETAPNNQAGEKKKKKKKKKKDEAERWKEGERVLSLLSWE